MPAGTTNYLWDDLGQGFASGTVAINLDWPGWAGFFNDPKSSKVAGNVGVKVQPKGSSGKRTGWSGHHGFSVTENCANKEAAASLVWWLTNEDSQKLEAAAGPLPTRTAVWEWDIEQAKADPYKTEVLTAFQEAAQNAFPVPQTAEWIEISNAVYPELQAAILGDKTSKEALDLGREGDGDPRGSRQALVGLQCAGGLLLSPLRRLPQTRACARDEKFRPPGADPAAPAGDDRACRGGPRAAGCCRSGPASRRSG